MAVNWNLQAVEVLEKLGCTGTGGRETFEKFERENGVKLPKALFDFLCVAQNNPLFRTADIWTKDRPFMYFFYEEIDEMIESDREYWEKNPKDCEENDYYKLSKIPRKDWEKHVPNFLVIGSDSAAGVVEFGVLAEDLAKEDPPVYMQHEADPITVWTLHNDTVSDYTMQVLCDVLACVEYYTAQQVLKKAGWTFQEYGAPRRGLPERGSLEEGWAILRERNVDVSGAKKHASLYGIEAYCCCGWDEEAQTLYVVRQDPKDPGENHFIIFSKQP